MALISVGEPRRWQLPKGLVEPGEEPVAAARREVREETGLEAEVVAPIDRIDYWYLAAHDGRRVRIHKFVHFHLLRATGGNVLDHDHEVVEAKWFALEEAVAQLAFASERRVLEKAAAMLGNRDD